VRRKRLSEQKKTVIGFRSLCKPNTEHRTPNNESGVALIIIVAIIAILSAIGVTFMYNMRLEEKASFNYLNSLKASYIAKSGIEHAIAVLKEDGGDTGFDAYNSDKWGFKYQDTADSIFSAYDDNDSINNDSFLGNFGLLTTVSPNCNEGRDSRWIYVADDNGDTVGRYAVLIIDESSKININTAGNISGPANKKNASNQGWKVSEINIQEFIEAGNAADIWDPNINVPHQKAASIVFYRYGGENTDKSRPGEKEVDDDADSILYEYDGIDNDADWKADEMDYNGNGRPDPGEYDEDKGCDEPDEGVDEPDEFIPWKPYPDDSGDTPDKPYITIEEVKMAGYQQSNPNDDIGYETFQKIKPYITVYSFDENTDDSGFLRLNINLVKDAMALYTVMYDAWKDLIPSIYSYDEVKRLASQVAVNTIDYADTDNVTTFLEMTDITGGETTIARGVEGIRINEVMVKPAYQWEAEELFESQNPVGAGGELGTTEWYLDLGDTFIYSIEPSETIDATMEIKRPGFYRVRVLSYSDALLPDGGTASSVPVPGNTLYDTDASPPKNWETNIWENATITIGNQTWWIDHNDANSITIEDSDWGPTPPVAGDVYYLEKDNSFNVYVYKGSDDILEDSAGAHNIGGWLLEDLGVAEIEEAGDYTIELETSPSVNKDTGARVDYVQLSQQPDCEYVELVNISDRDIDISGWTLTTSGGYIGTIPPDTTIYAGDYLVLVVDKQDNVSGIKDNDISFKDTWPDVDLDNVKQLVLSTNDLFNIAETAAGDTIVLAGSIFEDSPLITPDTLDDSGSATQNATSTTLTDGNKNWTKDKWVGAIITVDTVAGSQSRRIISNTTDTVTISIKWDTNPVNGDNYYIHFEPMAITLWEDTLDKQKIVTQVNYLASDVQDTPCYTQTDGTPVYGFVALEKNDPTAIYDRDEDGIDDSWILNNVDSEIPEIYGGTPGGPNVRFQYENRDLRNIEVRNLPFATIGDIKEVSVSDTENEWSKLGYDTDGNPLIEEIRALADKITVSEKRLEAENATIVYRNPADWIMYPLPPNEAPDDTFLTYYYSTSASDSAGTWIWGIDQRINPDTGIYTLYISGKVARDIDDPDTMLVKVTTGVKEYEARELSFSEDNIACFGQITIGGGIDGGDTDLLQLEIWKDYPENTISFDAAILAPEYRTYGRIDINTADTPVLQALPGITEDIADAIVAYREGLPPYSSPNPFDNIGEILSVLYDENPDESVDIFSKISNLITTKSKVFTIISTGQALRKSDKGTVEYPLGTGNMYEILGEKKYMVVVER
jgi:hypothetical protein